MSNFRRDHEILLTPAEVASLFRVDPKLLPGGQRLEN